MNESMQVLEMIEAGEISAEEGARRLEAITGETATSQASSSPSVTVPRPAMVDWGCVGGGRRASSGLGVC